MQIKLLADSKIKTNKLKTKRTRRTVAYTAKHICDKNATKTKQHRKDKKCKAGDDNHTKYRQSTEGSEN